MARQTTAAPQPAPVSRAGTAVRQPEPRPAPRKKEKEKKHLPGWALSLIFALGFVAVGVGGFYAYRHFRGEGQAAAALGFEAPSSTPGAPAKPNVLVKHIEVTGLRLTEDSNKKTQVQFLVVNHSAADIANLAGSVTLVPATEKGEEKPMGTFSFEVPSLGPYESRDLKAPLATQLRVYELPDWQFLRAHVQITSP